MTSSWSPSLRGSLRLPCSSDAQHGGKQKNISHKFEKSFRYRDAQHGGKQKNIIRKFEKTFCCRDAQHTKFEKTFCSKDVQHTGKQKDMIRKFETVRSYQSASVSGMFSRDSSLSGGASHCSFTVQFDNHVAAFRREIVLLQIRQARRH